MSDAHSREHSLNLTLILGGVRSGKSARALSLARASDPGRGVLFVATAQALDAEMRQRISVHQSERPASWSTLESPIDVAADLEGRLGGGDAAVGVVIIDCLTLWVSNVLLSLDDDADAESVLARNVVELIDVCARNQRTVATDGVRPRRFIVVSNEVGLGVVPPTSLGRRYRDALGRVNQIVAAAANEVILMVAGIPLSIKSE